MKLLSLFVNKRSEILLWMTLFRAGNSSTGVFGVFLGAILGLGAIPNGPNGIITSLHAISVFSFMCAWNALNDYLDIEIDSINRPERPLPSGEIKPSTAKIAISLMLFFSLASMSAAGLVAISSGKGFDEWKIALLIWTMALFLLVNYESSSAFSLSLKDRGLPGNIAISLSVGLVVIFGAAGVSEPFNHRAWSVFVLGFLYNLAREIIKDIEDMEGDKGRETFAMKKGPENARIAAWLILLLTLGFTIFPFAVGIFEEFHLVLVIPSVVTLLMAKPKLFSGNDRIAQMMIKRSMQLCLLAFLFSSLTTGLA